MRRLSLTVTSTLTLAAIGLSAPAPVAADPWEVSVYSGVQTAPHSGVDGTVAGIGDFSFTTGWEGKSGEAPPYYGFRATYWFADTRGIAVEFNHAKVYANEGDRAAAGFDRLEFTDGLNLLTVNYMQRWTGPRAWTPYVGVGAGVAIPHVDVKTSDSETFEYQLTGPAVIALAGVSYAVTDTWSVFGEYKGSYSQNTADLDGGGTLSSDIITNALNIGVSFNF